jgi:hypothetical protein
MSRILRTILFLTMLLSACSPTPGAPQKVQPATTEAPFLLPTTAIPDPKIIATVSTPHIDQGPDGAVTLAPPDPQNCGYQWANQDLPELSSSFQHSLQALQPEALGNAYIFGENCILSDGSIGAFLPRETDFNITLQVSDLNNESDLGAWIVKVMQVVTEIPPEQIIGPLPGRVFLVFQSGGDQKAINFSINQFQNLPSDLSDAEFYQALQVPQ